MKTLYKYIKDYHTVVGERNNYNDIYDYFNGSIPEEIDTDNVLLAEIIDENLRSHDIEALTKKLDGVFNSKIVSLDKYSGTGNLLSVYITVNDLSIQYNEKFLNIISLYNYYIQLVNHEEKYILISPIYSSTATDYVWDNYGKGYVVVLKNSIKQILSSGLRPRAQTDENSGGKIKNRLYMFSSYKKLDDLNHDYFNKFVNKIRKYKEVGLNNLCIIKIDLNKYPASNGGKIVWYKDNLMIEDEAVFTEQPIPAVCLSEIEMPKYIKEL